MVMKVLFPLFKAENREVEEYYTEKELTVFQFDIPQWTSCLQTIKWEPYRNFKNPCIKTRPICLSGRVWNKKKEHCLPYIHQHLKEKDALSKEARTTNRKKFLSEINAAQMTAIGNRLRLINHSQERSAKFASGIQRLLSCERKQPLRGYTTVLETHRRIRHRSYQKRTLLMTVWKHRFYRLVGRHQK